MTEPRYTLFEAQRELALRECAMGGHYPASDPLTGRGMAIYCLCECGLYVWVRQDAKPARCPEVGRQGQQCLREMSEFRLPSGEWRCACDHVTEPCGNCEGCREIAAINRSGVRDDIHNTPLVEDTWPLLTRRQYLVLTTMEQTGCDVFLALEAVASTAISHPEIDYDERRTFTDWESARAGNWRTGPRRRRNEP